MPLLSSMFRTDTLEKTVIIVYTLNKLKDHDMCVGYEITLLPGHMYVCSICHHELRYNKV